MSDDIFEPEVKEEQNERIVSYMNSNAFITIHIRNHTDNEKKIFDANLKNALRQFYRDAVSNGCAPEKLTAKYKKQTS